jgi:imidazolonepropionase-like amidohydrolase
LPFASIGSAQSTPDTPPLVILNVTVINPARSSVQPGRAVVVCGNHITSVSDAAHFQIPAHARVIDGKGQFLIPGLWDMHVHCAFGDWFPGGRGNSAKTL